MGHSAFGRQKPKVLMAASVASMIDQFNMPNIRLMQEMGFEVHVACNFKEGNTCDDRRLKELVHTLHSMQAVCHQWDCPRSIRSVPACIRAYRQLQRLLQRHAFAWMHCHSPIGGALARTAAHRAGVPIVYTAHGFHFYRGAPLKNWFLFYPAEKLLSYWTDVLITVNREDYRSAKRHLHAGRVRYIPGVGIDTVKFSADGKRQWTRQEFLERYQIPPDAKVLLSVGELNKGKNHRTALAAAARLAQPNVYYLICGQGALQDKLLHYADRLGIRSRIRIPGFQENMPEIYRNADIFVFPSVREGMPAALMEAMACGKPCAVSDIRGNRELVTDRRVRFQPKAVRQLCRVLELLLEDDAFRKTCAARNQNKMKHYSRAAVQKKMKKIYASMNQGRRTACSGRGDGYAGNIGSDGNL